MEGVYASNPKIYPKELQWEDFDDISWRESTQFADENINPGDTIVIKNDEKRKEAAKLMAEEISGAVYTQVDLDDDTGYALGIHKDGKKYNVSSNPIYEVVKL
jgi:hypothetical protein